MGEVCGVVEGNFGRMSECIHLLVTAIANSLLLVAGPTLGRWGGGRTDLAVFSIRRCLGVIAVRCQGRSLLGRLDTFGPGGAAATSWSWQALELAPWYQEEQAMALAKRHGHRALRR